MVCSGPAELKELLDIMCKLTTLGVIEINRAILEIIRLSFPIALKDKDLVEHSFKILNSLIF